MSERSGASSLAAMTLEEPGAEQASPRAPGPLRCGPCAVWPRQQTWLCAVPLVMGFVGLGLSLMLLKWIVVGSVQDYVPTDLVDPKGSIGQDAIYLSNPSAIPKGPDISTDTTTLAVSPTAVVSTTTPLAADGTALAPRTKSEPPANHSANGSAASGDGNRAPPLYNHAGTRISGTVVTTSATRTTRLPPPPSGKEVTPRSPIRKGGSAGNGRNGVAYPMPGQTSPTVTAATSTTATATVKSTIKVPQTTSQPAAPMKPTSRWTPGRPGKGPATRPHRVRTPLAPTLPTVRSEVFKPCVEDKDLAFCLNDGECSIIETVAGVHRHCRCKEGYHGLRCDQFVPKTDAILSDPTDELGIEFMESGDTYQRQVLSIFSIASGICLLGVACMALYRRNKKHREKLQAHFSETRSLRDCSVNASGLMSKSTLKLQYSLHLQKGCNAHGASLTGGNVTPGTSSATPPILSKALSKGKRFSVLQVSQEGQLTVNHLFSCSSEHEEAVENCIVMDGVEMLSAIDLKAGPHSEQSSSLSFSPAQQRREATHFRTPPISRGRNKVTTNLIDGSRVVGHVYKHLQEDESTDTESIRRCDSATGRIGTFLTKTPLTNFTARKGWMEVPCTRLDKATTFLPSSMRTRSVPIIPSLQACDSETEHVHSGEQNQPGPIKWHPALAGKIEPPVSNPSSQPETVMLMNSVLPRNVSPPAITCNPLESEDITSANAPCPFEFSAEFSKDFNQKHLSNPKKTSGFCSEFHHHGKNMLEAGTVQESEEGNVQYSTRALHTGSATRGLKASGQKEVKGQCQGQTSLVKGGANCFLATKGPSCRVTGNTYAKPSAS